MAPEVRGTPDGSTAAPCGAPDGESLGFLEQRVRPQLRRGRWRGRFGEPGRAPAVHNQGLLGDTLPAHRSSAVRVPSPRLLGDDLAAARTAALTVRTFNPG